MSSDRQLVLAHLQSVRHYIWNDLLGNVGTRLSTLQLQLQEREAGDWDGAIVLPGPDGVGEAEAAQLPRVEDPLIRTSSTFGKVPEIPPINGVAIFFT